MKKNYIYDFLLPFFTASDDLLPAMKHIHKDADGYVYATNSHILIRIPADQVAGFDTIKFVSNPANNSSAALFKFDDIVIMLVPFMPDNPTMIKKTKIVTK